MKEGERRKERRKVLTGKQLKLFFQLVFIFEHNLGARKALALHNSVAFVLRSGFRFAVLDFPLTLLAYVPANITEL